MPRFSIAPHARFVPRALFVLIVCCVVAVLFASDAQAQEEPRAVETSAPDVSVRLSGTFQPRLSYGFTSGDDDDLQRLGFGIRRARLRATATFTSRFGVHYDVDLGSGSLSSVDLYGFYRPTPRVRLRMGYLAGAQPRAYIFTSHTRIDAIERAAIAERWARGTIGSSGRDFGLEGRYQTPDLTVEVFLHNGDGSFDRARGNFRESVSSSATRGVDLTRMAAGTYLSYEPGQPQGLDIGGFVGYNAARNPNTAPDGLDEGRAYLTYSGHVYWGASPGSQPVRLKADALAIRYEALDDVGVDVQQSAGYAVLGAVRVLRHGEAFARYERFYADTEEARDDYVTAGLSYSLSARRGLPYRQERLTLAYANALPENASAADQHLVVLQLQFVF